MEVELDVGRRDVDDEHVEEPHERRDEDDRERDPATRVSFERLHGSPHARM
jgi:hypothetical protein